MGKAPVSERALIQLLNGKIKEDDLVLKKMQPLVEGARQPWRLLRCGYASKRDCGAASGFNRSSKPGKSEESVGRLGDYFRNLTSLALMWFDWRTSAMLFFRRARVAELADAPDSKSGGRKAVMVRPHSRAPIFFPLLPISPKMADFRALRCTALHY
jgi:hypothetical protein